MMHRKYTNLIYKEAYTVATPLQILANSNLFQELSSINVNRLNYVILGQVIIENQTLATIFSENHVQFIGGFFKQIYPLTIL